MLCTVKLTWYCGASTTPEPDPRSPYTELRITAHIQDLPPSSVEHLCSICISHRGLQDQRAEEHRQHAKRKGSARETQRGRRQPKSETCIHSHTGEGDRTRHFLSRWLIRLSWRFRASSYPILSDPALVRVCIAGMQGAHLIPLFLRIMRADLQGRREDGDHLAERVSGVAVPHLRQREASALHCVAQLPCVKAPLVNYSERHQTVSTNQVC